MDESETGMSTNNLIAIRVMQAKFEHIEKMQKITLGISGVNLIVLLIMILQLSTKIFGQ